MNKFVKAGKMLMVLPFVLMVIVLMSIIGLFYKRAAKIFWESFAVELLSTD